MSQTRQVQVLESLLKVNDYLADQLQVRWNKTRTFVVNLLSSPGAGKTALLEATLPRLPGRSRCLVLQGDIATERDAERIRALGVRSVQITTGGTCHLEAHMIEQALALIQDEEPFDYLFIENVGNLVCPAGYRLGEHFRVVLLSVPEGGDKPKKYPAAFRSADGLLITKADLLPYVDFDVKKARQEALDLQPWLQVQVVSARTGEGLPEWLMMLQRCRDKLFGESSTANETGRTVAVQT